VIWRFRERVGKRVQVDEGVPVLRVLENLLMTCSNDVRRIPVGNTQFAVTRIARHMGCRMHSNTDMPDQESDQDGKAEMSGSKCHAIYDFRKRLRFSSVLVYAYPGRNALPALVQILVELPV